MSIRENLRVTIAENEPSKDWHGRYVGPLWVSVYWNTEHPDEPQAWKYLPRILWRHRSPALWTYWFCVAVSVQREVTA